MHEQVAKNSFKASFIGEEQRMEYYQRIDQAYDAYMSKRQPAILAAT